MRKWGSLIFISKGLQGLLAPTMQLKLMHLSLGPMRFLEHSKSNSLAVSRVGPLPVMSYSRAKRRPPMLTCSLRKRTRADGHSTVYLGSIWSQLRRKTLNSMTGDLWVFGVIHSQIRHGEQGSHQSPTNIFGLQLFPVRQKSVEYLSNCHFIHPFIHLSSNKY